MRLLFSIGQKPKGKVGFEEAEWPRKTGESIRLKVILQSRETVDPLPGGAQGGSASGEQLFLVWKLWRAENFRQAQELQRPLSRHGHKNWHNVNTSLAELSPGLGFSGPDTALGTQEDWDKSPTLLRELSIQKMTSK